MAKTAVIFFAYWFPNWIRVSLWQNFNKVEGPGHDSQLVGTHPNDHEWCSFIQHTLITGLQWAWLCGLLALPIQLLPWCWGYRVSGQERQHEFWSLFQSAFMSASEEKSLWELLTCGWPEKGGHESWHGRWPEQGCWSFPFFVPGNHDTKTLQLSHEPRLAWQETQLSRGDMSLWSQQIASEFAACGEICIMWRWEILGSLVGLLWKYSQQIFI